MITRRRLILVWSPAKPCRTIQHNLHQLVLPDLTTESKGHLHPLAHPDGPDGHHLAHGKVGNEVDDSRLEYAHRHGHDNRVGIMPDPVGIDGHWLGPTRIHHCHRTVVGDTGDYLVEIERVQRFQITHRIQPIETPRKREGIPLARERTQPQPLDRRAVRASRSRRIVEVIATTTGCHAPIRSEKIRNQGVGCAVVVVPDLIVEVPVVIDIGIEIAIPRLTPAGRASPRTIGIHDDQLVLT